VGDGKDPATYGFDLGNLLISRKTLAASGLPRDGLPALSFPRLFTPRQADSLHQAGHYKYLVSGDRVIGVFLGGRARAYPVALMNWHEVVNDSLGGWPIVVTYSPLCDAAAVFDRRPLGGARSGVEGLPRAPDGGRAGDEVATQLFELSGLLCNSNLVLYDRQPGHRGESLWSQLEARAIAGPAAGRGDELRVLPCVVARWADWRARYPETTVPEPEPARRERYLRDPYVHDFGSDLLRFPVDPLPPRGDLGWKAPCVIVGLDRRFAVYPLALLAERAGASGVWETRQGGTTLRFNVRTPPLTAWVEAAAGEEPEVIYSFWFAWYAGHPDMGLLVR
jgi:hypothetical protein